MRTPRSGRDVAHGRRIGVVSYNSGAGSMSSSTPSTLGKYQIIREIARSNDIVYEAYDPLMNRRVALKELAMPGGATSQQKEDRIKRFLREARAAGSLQHPNIMTVFEVGEEAGRYYIAMEFLDGKTLRNELDQKGFLEPDRAIEIAKGVLAGLAYAHSKGVIHRDIKPDNIQLTTNGGIKLTDFGIARLTFEPNLTMDGQVFGTPSYMSPEQVVGRDIDQRSDLFSVGIVLYEMFAGSKPFAGDSVVAITYAIMNKRPDRPPQINHAIWQVLERALDKSPQLRFKDANEFTQALSDASRASASVVIDPILPGRQVAAPPTQTYGANPYAGPAPPVLANPYTYQPGQSSYGGPSQTPYDPIPAQPSVYTGPQPVYYPPPPRRPLIKPAVWRILGQLVGSALVLGAIIAILISSLNWFSKVSERTSRASSKTPPGKARPAPARSSPISASNQEAAAARHRQGQRLWESGQVREAEAAFREAVRLEPTSAEYHESLAAALFGRAGRESSPPTQIDLYDEAAREFAAAADRESVDRTKQRLRTFAAQAFYQSAVLLWGEGKAREARERLWDARPLAEHDPALLQEIERLRVQLSSYR